LDSTLVAASDSAQAVALLMQTLPGLDPKVAAMLGGLVAAVGVYAMEWILQLIKGAFPKQLALVQGVWSAFRWILNPLLGVFLSKWLGGDPAGGLLGYAGLRTLGALVSGLMQTPETMKKLAATLAVCAVAFTFAPGSSIAQTTVKLPGDETKESYGPLAALTQRSAWRLGAGYRWEFDQDATLWAGARFNLALSNKLGLQLEGTRDWVEAAHYSYRAGLWIGL